MINPLLDLWSVASAVDHSAAAPIESLLSALVHRSVMTPAEVSTVVREVEVALALLTPRPLCGAPGC